jgi:type I restriction enzyme R subunit
LPQRTRDTLKALTAQFAFAGTEGLETPQVFHAAQVVRAGGLAALKELGKPADILRDTNMGMFAA